MIAPRALFVRRFFAVATAAAALALGACAGGHVFVPADRGGLPAANQPGANLHASGTRAPALEARRRRHARKAYVRIVIPRRRHHGPPKMHPLRRPGYVSSGSQSIVIHLVSVAGGTPPSGYPDLVANLNPSAPHCTNVDGNTSCTLSFLVPEAHAVVLAVTLYSGTLGTGSALSTGTSSAIDTTASGASFSVTLDGIANLVVASPAAIAAYDDGSVHVLSFEVSARDASGAVVTQPGNYTNPITISVANDAGGALTVSPTSIPSPGPSGLTQVNVSYNTATAFTDPAQPATITVRSGTGSATLTVAPMILTVGPAGVYTATGSPQLNFVLGGANASIVAREPGYSGAFSEGWVGRTDIGVGCVPASCAPSTSGGSVTLTLSPQTITGTPSPIHGMQINDANGANASFSYAVTGPTGVGPITVGPYTINLMTINTSDVDPVGITTGPNGQGIWVADASPPAAVGRFLPSACPASGSMCTPIWKVGSLHFSAIAAGGDGNLYAVGSASDTSGNAGVQQIELAGNAGCQTGASLTCPIVAFGSTGGAPIAIVRGNDFAMHAVNVRSTSPASASNGSILTIPYPAPTSSPPYAAPSPVPATSYGVTSMADGPGNTIFVTDNVTNDIGLFDTATSTYSEYGYAFPHGGSGSTFGGIALGSDGATMWVTLPSDNAVAYFPAASCCTASNVTPLAVAHGVPTAIAAGPDRNIWFTASDASGSYIGMINPRATPLKVTEYQISTTNLQLDGITTGPDGNIWFTGYDPTAQQGYIGEVVIP